MSKAFRRRGALAQREMHFGPNMAPMVDIMLVILIFFMVGMSFVGPEWFLRAALPVSAQGSRPAAIDPFELPPAPFTITLAPGPDGRTRATGLGLTNAPLPQFIDRLRSFSQEVSMPDTLLVLVPDPRVPYADVVSVHDACFQVGFEHVGLGGS